MHMLRLELVTSGERVFTRGHIVWGFSLGKFSVTLDCFCRWPVGMLIDIMQGNPDIRATGNGAQLRADGAQHCAGKF